MIAVYSMNLIVCVVALCYLVMTLLTVEKLSRKFEMKDIQVDQTFAILHSLGILGQFVTSLGLIFAKRSPGFATYTALEAFDVLFLSALDLLLCCLICKIVMENDYFQRQILNQEDSSGESDVEVTYESIENSELE